MRVLALETSGNLFSVALLEDDEVVRQVTQPSLKTVEPQSGSSARLAPTIQDLFLEQNWRIRDLNGIAVSIGPGSFTGLRVGLTTAKTLAYAMDKPICGINTLQVLAAQVEGLPHTLHTIHTVVNAQRSQLFAASYAVRPGQLPETKEPLRILDRAEWLDSLRPADHVTGTGLVPLRDRLAERSDIEVTPESCWQPQAGTVGKLAWERLVKNESDDFWTLAPLYFRPSAAEEKRKNLA